MALSNPKVLIDEAEALLAAIRGGVLVHVQDGILPANLKAPLDFARVLNSHASQIDDESVKTASDALEAWLSMLAAETEQISDTHVRGLLDQISELEVALVAYKARSSSATLDVVEFVEESFEVLRSAKGFSRNAPRQPDKRGEDAEADSELLEVFNEEAQSLLQSIKSNLEVLSTRPKDRDALWEIKKSAHTFKGAAGVVGLRKLSDLAHRVEDLLDQLSEKNVELNVHIVGLLLNAADCLEVLSSDDRSSEIDSKIDSLYEEFGKALGSLSPLVEANGDAKASAMPLITPRRRASDFFPSRRRSNAIVRVSLDRLDELVGNIRDLFASRSAFEQRLTELDQQLEESNNNGLRLLAACGKIDALKINSATDDNGTAYELAEAVKDATVINTAFDNVKSNLEALYDAQCSLIDEVQERLLRLRNVEFGTILNRLQRTVRVTCDEEDKRAEVVLENGTVEVDTQLIDSLIEPLLHLLKNAVVHGIENPETRRILGKPEAGKITLRVSNKGAYTVLSVTDDGRGIAFGPLLEKAVASNLISRAEAEQMTSDKIRELIFLPGLTTAKKLNLNAGRGVGMSIVRESIAAAGGTISIETWPQKGTTFTMKIPRPFAGPAVEQHRPSTASHTSSDRMRLMIVDDSPSVRLMTSRVVEKTGWHVETARDGVDALEKLRILPPPNLILSDIEMPRMGGFEFVAALRDDPGLKDIPVVFISSRSDDTDREQAAAAGVAEYLTKPYDPMYLLELINRLTLTPAPVEAERTEIL